MYLKTYDFRAVFLFTCKESTYLSGKIRCMYIVLIVRNKYKLLDMKLTR